MDEQPLSPIRAEGSAHAPHNPPVLAAPEVPQLEVGLMAMTIHDQNQQQQIQEGEEKYTLLMKVACTGGTPRALSLNTVQQTLARAWRNNFHRISQVNQFVFKAHFTSFEAMMWVYTKQPWTISSDTLLLELENRNKKEISEENYKFEYIYMSLLEHMAFLRSIDPLSCLKIF
jgi:hypothetical protein